MRCLVTRGILSLLFVLAAVLPARAVSFERLRALGDSLTINTQGGIVSDYRTQVRGWVPLLAQQIGTEMRLPLLSKMNSIGQQRREDYPDYQHTHCLAYNGVSVDDTFMKVAPEIPGYMFGWAYNHLDLILADRPGYTMVSALKEDDPTFVVGFLGSNDFMSRVMARGTMMEGIPTLGLMDEIDPLDAEGMRPQHMFRSDFETVVSTLYKPGVGMCFGTLPTLPDIPGIMTKAELTAFLGPNSLPEGCYTNYTVAAGVRGGLQGPEIFADDRNYYTEAELQTINEAIYGYNNTIREAAANPAHPFAVVETPIQAPGTISGDIHVNGWQINNQIFVDNLGKPRTSIMTTDGVHMTDIGNALCAQAYIRAINAYYGTSIPELNEAQMTAILNADRFADNDADGKMEGISCGVFFLTLNFVYPNETGDSDEIPLNAKVLTTNVTPSGTGRIERSVPGPEYFEGTVVTLTALPEPGTLSFFSHWAGDVPVGSSNENPLTITMNAHRTITAVFDAYPPNVICIPDQVLHTDSGTCQTFAPDWTGQVQVSDDSTPAGELSIMQLPPPGAELSVAGSPYYFVMSAVDRFGRSGQCQFAVTVVDGEAPVINCPEDATLMCDAGAKAVAAPDWISNVAILDNCSPFWSMHFGQEPEPGTTLSAIDSPHTITLTAQDEAGNTGYCTFVANVEMSVPQEGEPEGEPEGEGEDEGEVPGPCAGYCGTTPDGICYCDEYCHMLGDCCTDVCVSCPGTGGCEGEGEVEGEGGCGHLLPYFVNSPSQGGAPVTVRFNNYSSGYSRCIWEFGDYARSSETNPSHLYRVPGTYTISLHVWDACGAHKVYKSFVTVLEAVVEGEGEIPAEGEGEVLPEGEGEVPVEGEGEVLPEGEGEVPAEGEGEVLPEGEGEILPEGEGEILPEGEGEALPEGEGEVLPEGEGEIVPEGEGEILPEGEGEILPEGEGEVLPEGEGEVLPEGEGEVLPEGEGEILPEGEGEVLPEGEGEVPAEGEGEVLPEGEGEVLPEGEGEVLPEGEGEVLSEGEGEVLSEGEGEVLPEGEGEVLPEGEGEVLPEGEGEVLPEGEGEVLPEGEGEVLPEGEGEIAPEGEGEIVAEGEGEVPSEGEGEVLPEGEGEILVEGEGEVLPEGEGEILVEGEGEPPVEGETIEGESPEGEALDLNEVAEELLERFDELDVNEDGLLSYEEVLAAFGALSEEQFGKLDGDNNGFLSREELDAFLNPPACCGCGAKRFEPGGIFGDWLLLGLSILVLLAFTRKTP